MTDSSKTRKICNTIRRKLRTQNPGSQAISLISPALFNGIEIFQLQQNEAHNVIYNFNFLLLHSTKPRWIIRRVLGFELKHNPFL